MTAAFVADRTELERVPDGTVISWLRIPGDHTSEAVAFVRREIDHDDQIGPPRQVTWISPGGWEPMSIADAGVTFPATVIRWGEVPVSEPELAPIAWGTIDSGGTWAREKALECATRLYSGDTVLASLSDITSTADAFVEWLTRSELVTNGLHFGQMMLDLNDGRMSPPDTAQGFMP